ncbi:MAG: hypothetical protein J6T96_10340 [Bacteroidales bacterium]|nr:hypothetical protein [Bacteroidales bacterium]
MKATKFLSAALLLIMAAMLSACGPTSKEAGMYNDMLMEQQKAVVIKYDELLESFDTYVPEKMDAALMALTNQIDDSRTQVNQITAIVGGENLKNEVLEYLTVLNAATTDFEYLVRLYKKPENEFKPEDRIDWEARYKDVDSRIKEAATKLKDVQHTFAETFNLQIMERTK